MINKINFLDNTPLYLQLHNILKDKIESSEWKEGELIPGENQISEIFQVSRVTVRQALDLLVRDKYLVRRPGFGTIVYRNKAALSNFTLIQSFTNEMNEMRIRNETLEAKLTEIAADEELANIFNIKKGSKLYKLCRLRGAVEQPIVYSETYLLPVVRIPNDDAVLYGSLYSYLTSQNVAFDYFNEIVSAIRTFKEMSDKLRIPEDGVLLKRIRYSYATGDELIEYTINYYNSELYDYRANIYHKK